MWVDGFWVQIRAREESKQIRWGFGVSSENEGGWDKTDLTLMVEEREKREMSRWVEIVLIVMIIEMKVGQMMLRNFPFVLARSDLQCE